MAAAAAAAAARKPAADEKKSSNNAVLLFIGGIVVLSGAVGYAKWSAMNPVQHTVAKEKKEKKLMNANKKASETTSSSSSSPSSPTNAEEAIDKKAADLVNAREEKQKAAAAAEEEKKESKKTSAESTDEALAKKKQELAEKKKKEAEEKKQKVQQPFAAASEEEEAKKKKAAAEAEEKKKKEAAAAAAEANNKEATIKPLVEALAKVATVNTDLLDIETDVSRRPYFAGHHVFAKTEIPADTSIVTLMGSLQFSVRTVDKAIQKGLAVLVHHAAKAVQSVKDHLADSPYYNVEELLPKLHDDSDLFNLAATDKEEDETEPQPSTALDGDLHLLMLSLVMEKKKGKRSIWHPWIDSLPPIHHLATHHGMFVSNEEFVNCLPNRGQHIVNDMRREMMWIRNSTAELCRVQIPKLEPKLDAFREQQEKQSRGEKVTNFVKFSELERAAIMARFLVCEAKQADLDWAYAIISARSHLIGNVRTIFPLIDVLPYAVSAAVKPGKMQATEDGKIMSLDFVTARTVEADEPLSFRTSIREPIEAVISQGFFDTDFFTDNAVPIGIYFQIDKDGETFNPQDLGEQVGVNCQTTVLARAIPENGEVPLEMLLCSDLVFLKNVTATADFELEKLQKLRDELIDIFMADKAARDKKDAEIASKKAKKVPQTLADIATVAPSKAGEEGLLTDAARQAIREKSIAFITRAVSNAKDIYNTRAKGNCQEDSRSLMGEIQSHNDYVVSILEKTLKIFGIEPEEPEIQH